MPIIWTTFPSLGLYIYTLSCFLRRMIGHWNNYHWIRGLIKALGYPLAK